MWVGWGGDDGTILGFDYDGGYMMMAFMKKFMAFSTKWMDLIYISYCIKMKISKRDRYNYHFLLKNILLIIKVLQVHRQFGKICKEYVESPAERAPSLS